jgi:hypothetical protein
VEQIKGGQPVRVAELINFGNFQLQPISLHRDSRQLEIIAPGHQNNNGRQTEERS